MTAWAFLVVSSDHQSDTLPFQRQWAARTAAENGWSIISTFEAVSSGRDGLRDLLESLLRRLRSTPANERPERVLMTRLDRLGRGTALGPLAAFAEITRLGVKIHTRQDGDYQLSRASDSILPMMRIITAAIENESRIDKAVSVYERRRSAGLVVGTKRPYGLRLEKAQDVPDGDRADVVTKAFELAANGFGLNAIGKRLTALAPPQSFRNGRVHSVDWTADRVRKLLVNEAYRGVVVDDATWLRVVAMRAAMPTDRVKTKNAYPLSGAMQCECGRRLVGTIRGSMRKRVYVCRSVATHGRVLAHLAERLERGFEDIVGSLHASPELVSAHASGEHIGDSDQRLLEQSLERAQAAVRSADRERDRIWALNETGQLRDEDLQTRLDALRGRIAEAESESAALERRLSAVHLLRRERANARETIANASLLWARAEVDDRKAIAKAVARALGGLTVAADGRLSVGAPDARRMFYKRAPTRRDAGEPEQEQTPRTLSLTTIEQNTLANDSG